ncbi:hypothetical protein FA13DRAFT_1746205 [Coprinellus micaceus]|uniref:Uncharacterized protein n=1 Tax=Coprinellus micaceus TaxID=71717 RepID=A0A4Y7S9T6_COPMI|nr:hypothetical protein FA13DRAFT_1746205 [Coprinellus micaceus]
MSSRDERGGLIWKPQTRPAEEVAELVEALRSKLHNETPDGTPTPSDSDAAPHNPSSSSNPGGPSANGDGSMTGGHGQAPPPPPPAPQQNGAPPHIPLPVTTMLPGQAATPIDGYPGNHLYEAGIRAYIPESHRHLLDLLLHARTTGNPMLVPLVLDLLGIQNILGTVHGTPPVFFITSVLTADDYNSLLVLPCYNTLTFTAFVAPNVTPRMMRPIQLRGILEIEYSDENVTLIAMSIRGTLQGDPRVWQAMDMFHDAVAPPPGSMTEGLPSTSHSTVSTLLPEPSPTMPAQSGLWNETVRLAPLPPPLSGVANATLWTIPVVSAPTPIPLDGLLPPSPLLKEEEVAEDEAVEASGGPRGGGRGFGG